MKTDIEIAQEAKMSPILEVAESIGLNEEILRCMENIRPKFPWTFGRG